MGMLHQHKKAQRKQARQRRNRPNNQLGLSGWVLDSAEGYRFFYGTEKPLPQPTIDERITGASRIATSSVAMIVPTAEWLGMAMPAFSSPEEEQIWQQKMMDQCEPPTPPTTK